MRPARANRDTNPVPSPESIRGEIGRMVDPEALGRLAGQAQLTAVKDIYRFLCEAAANAVEHAYPHRRQESAWPAWEATARLEADIGVAVFSVRDWGLGIPAVMRNRSGLNLSAADLVRLAVGTHDAPPNGPWRGRGLSGMIDLIRRDGGFGLDILTSGQSVLFTAGALQGRSRAMHSGPGTLVSLSVPLNGHVGSTGD